MKIIDLRSAIAFEQRMRAKVRITGKGQVVPIPLGIIGRMLVDNSATYYSVAGVNPKKRQINARKPS